MAATLLALGLVAPGRAGARALMFTFGFSGTILLTAASTIVQLLLGVAGTTPIGSMLLGGLVDGVDVPAAIATMGGGAALAALGAALFARRHGTLQVALPAAEPTGPPTDCIVTSPCHRRPTRPAPAYDPAPRLGPPNTPASHK